MQTLSARQAAELLHLNVKRVQSLARDGRLPAARVGRRWLFHRDQLERLLGTRHDAGGPGLSISARNRLAGRIADLRIEGLMAEVVIRIGDQELVAVIKSTEVMVGKYGVEA